MIVKKLPRGVSMDTIEMYFESKRKMGRDLEVRNVDLNADNNEAVVTFASTSGIKLIEFNTNFLLMGFKLHRHC